MECSLKRQIGTYKGKKSKSKGKMRKMYLTFSYDNIILELDIQASHLEWYTMMTVGRET